MPARRTARTKCFVSWCAYTATTKGLCGSHYAEYRISGDWKDEVNLFEIERFHNPTPMAYWTYVGKVKELAKSTGVPRAIRVPFQQALAKRYASYIGRSDD